MLRDWIISPWQLKKLAVLGMNSRNINFISHYNERRHYPLVDDKLQTKRAAEAEGITVPELLGVVESQWQLKQLWKLLEGRPEFVLKPTRGSGGKGILVVAGRDFDYFIKSNGSKMKMVDVRRHINNILSGLYSLGGKPDRVMVEARIQYDTVFDDYTYEGVPDVRVIVFRGFPIMAMLRCSTHASDGRANLHQGAIGVGIDITTGDSLLAVQHNRPVYHHPDTGKAFSGLTIPYWDTIPGVDRALLRNDRAGLYRLRYRARPGEGAGGTGAQCPPRSGHSGGQWPGAGETPATD